MNDTSALEASQDATTAGCVSKHSNSRPRSVGRRLGTGPVQRCLCEQRRVPRAVLNCIHPPSLPEVQKNAGSSFSSLSPLGHTPMFGDAHASRGSASSPPSHLHPGREQSVRSTRMSERSEGLVDRDDVNRANMRGKSVLDGCAVHARCVTSTMSLVRWLQAPLVLHDESKGSSCEGI